MHTRRTIITFLSIVGFALSRGYAMELPTAWGDAVWQLQIDPASGAVVHIENKNDPQHMNWLREAGHWDDRNWIVDSSPAAVTSDGQWGLVETSQTGLLHVAKVNRISDRAWEATYTSSSLTVVARRELDASGDLAETYTLKNTGNITLNFPVGSLSITAPFFDQYPDTQLSLVARCHTHLWMGGSSSWVNAMRMGTDTPHLGLVVTQGSLDTYSQRGGTFNDRGVFLLHPGAMKLEPGKSASISWKLFWHQGWDDFFAKLKATPNFVRLTAKDYIVSVGQPLEITVDSATALASAKVLANGQAVPTHIEGGHLTASIPTAKLGDLVVTLDQGGRKSVLRAYVTPPQDDLIDARVKFIVRKQQRNAPGDPLDGAYLAFDNETGQQIYDKAADHNAGRERVGMGVLGALYLPLCRDDAFKAELKQSLTRYSEFITRELEDENGVVYSDIGRKKNSRIYNCPWVAHFHLAMYRATGDTAQLDRFVRVIRSYYAQKGAKFYAIGLPIADGIKTLKEAGRTAECDELLALFREHADYILKNDDNYPRSEVNFEQSIVAPAVQMLAEMAVVTGDQSYLDGAKAQMPLLEAFAGKQPDSRLNEISIRHWDDYWFGKVHIYGDTLPHYWSTLNALAYAYYGLCSKDTSWLQRADTVLKGNLSLFTPEGAASAAHLYALTTNGVPGAKNDPWANDQDWVLVNLLTVRGIEKL